MTEQEFSDQFDVLYNNITSNQAPGLDEYEKSVFLTKAQEELVKNYFSPKGNTKQDGFDDSPKRQADFACLIRTLPLSYDDTIDRFDQRSAAFPMPTDLFICLNEQLMDGNIPITVVPISYSEYDRLMSKPYKYPPKYQAWRLITKSQVQKEVATVTYSKDFYTLVLSSSYKKPVRMKVVIGSETEPQVVEEDGIVTITCELGSTESSSRYWSKYLKDNDIIKPYLGDFSGNTGHSSFPSMSPEYLQEHDGEVWADVINFGPVSVGTPIAEIIGRFKNGQPSYRMRYIKRPRPIILVPLNDISNDLSIHGENTPMTSELSEELHEEILQRAVELAKVAWQGDVQTVTQSGQRSE